MTLSTLSMTHIEEALCEQMPRGRENLVYRKPLRKMNQRRVDGKHHIVFVAYYPYTAVVKKAMALQRNGRYYTTLIAACVREDAEIYQYFDQVFEVQHYAELADILPGADPWAFNVMSQPLILPLMVMCHAPDSRIVVDVNDGLFFSDPDQCSPECCIEQEIFQKADALVHKMPTEIFDEMAAEWNVDTPHRTVHSLPAPPLFANRPARIGDPVRVVLSGGLMPYHLARKRGYENHIIDDLILGLKKAGLHLTCYLNQNARNMYWHEHQHYLDFEDDNDAFRFLKGRPYHLLPQEISAFDYGIIYEDINISAIRIEHVQFNMATKFFSYLEAGLPILIHDQSFYMAELVTRHGIGIVYPQNDLGILAEKLRSANYGKLKAQVIQFRERYPVDAIIPYLQWAYEVDENSGEEPVPLHGGWTKDTDYCHNLNGLRASGYGTVPKQRSSII